MGLILLPQARMWKVNMDGSLMPKIALHVYVYLSLKWEYLMTGMFHNF